ncbi:MAG: hypothetical protein G01um101420_181 [Parcubacteria group bacterium Gr01-1014_20]|nr:MAG: hypothetical protein G01um101420_181 [Parcubacteria group bacterium Gr01-1014_20]
MGYLTVVLAMFGVGFFAWWFWGNSSFIFIRRRLEAFRDLPGVELFEESYFHGWPLKTRIVLRPGSQPLLASSPKVEAVKIPEVVLPDIFDQQIVLKLPRWPESEFRMPRYLPMVFLGKEGVYELIPITTEVAGYLRFATTETGEDLGGASDQKRSKWRSQRPLQIGDYIVQKSLAAIVVEHRFTREKFGYHVTVPSNGYILSFQVLNGSRVEKGDVILFLAASTSFILPKKKGSEVKPV